MKDKNGKELKNNQIVISYLHHRFDGKPIKGKFIIKGNNYIFEPIYKKDKNFEWQPHQDYRKYYAETYLELL